LHKGIEIENLLALPEKETLHVVGELKLATSRGNEGRKGP
jgi:hypothetical protein